MTLDVPREAEDGLALATWRFVLTLDGKRLVLSFRSLLAFRREATEDEWTEAGAFYAADVSSKSTLADPGEPPADVIQDAKQLALFRIELDT